ncbi:hypothetical protein HOG98_05485 [bacterium]|jgi:hypothetical protein|nr:hypothetical protein [bacterium]
MKNEQEPSQTTEIIEQFSSLLDSNSEYILLTNCSKNNQSKKYVLKIDKNKLTYTSKSDIRSSSYTLNINTGELHSDEKILPSNDPLFLNHLQTIINDVNSNKISIFKKPNK